MPPTLIGTDSWYNVGGGAMTTTLTVQVGDLIVVGCGQFYVPTPSTWVCSDSDGNTYYGTPNETGANGFRSNTGAFGQVVAFYAYAKSSTTITITTEETDVGPRSEQITIAANYRGAGKFDQSSRHIALYTPADKPLGEALGYFSLADTLVVTFYYTVDGTGGSDTGDSLILTRERLNLYDRQSTGPGIGTVKLKTEGDSNSQNIPAVCLTFSKPLSRPGGLESQYAIRPGAGLDSGYSLSFPQMEINAPLTVSFPYTPLIGSLVVVGVGNTVSLTPDISVEDDYGNTYTPLITAPNNTNSCRVVLFYTIVQNLPDTGDVFKVRMRATFTGYGGVYQHFGIAIVEKVITPESFTAVGFGSFSSSNPTVTIKSATIPNVEAGTYLVAVGMYPGNITQDTVDFSNSQGYTVQAETNFIQFPSSIPNNPRLQTLALMDWEAPSDGDYNAELKALISGNFGEDGAIALLAITEVPPEVCIPRTLRFQIPQKRWFPHCYADIMKVHYLDEPAVDQPNDQQLLMVSGGSVHISGGNDDNGDAIECIVTTPSNDIGDERLQKLYIDAMFDAEGTGDLQSDVQYNNQTANGPSLTVTVAGTREQFLENISSLGDLSLYRNISSTLSWTGGPDGPKVYAWEPAAYIQPYISRFFVTQYINLAFPGWKHHRRLYAGLISNSEVIFTIRTQDGRTYGPTTIPSTGGQFKIIPLMIPHGCKDLAFAYQIDGQGANFALFSEAWTLETKDWNGPEYIDLAIFNT